MLVSVSQRHSASTDAKSKTDIVRNPKILLASSNPYPSNELYPSDRLFPSTLELDSEAIKDAFQQSVVIEPNLTASRLRELLTKNNFDIVQLDVGVSVDALDGSVYCWRDSNGDWIPGDG